MGRTLALVLLILPPGEVTLSLAQLDWTHRLSSLHQTIVSAHVLNFMMDVWQYRCQRNGYNRIPFRHAGNSRVLFQGGHSVPELGAHQTIQALHISGLHSVIVELWMGGL